MKLVKVAAVVAVMSVMFSCEKGSIPNKPIKTELDSVSYALGLDMGLKVRANFSEIDGDLYLKGFMNGIDSVDVKMSQQEIGVLLNEYFKNKQQRDLEKKFEGIKKEGEDFLEANKSKEGVQTTASGLQYIVMKEGTGEKPTTASKVSVHYHGTLIDGTVFDSSVDRGKPSEFGVTQVIKGWTEGLQLMNVGSKYKFFVPQEIAYGANPRQGGPIKPYTMLIFEVELLEIK